MKLKLRGFTEETLKEYKNVNSPFKWVGGKSRLRKQIIALLPVHTCYVEPFAGAAWVLFGKPPSDVEVLNDIDEDLITFFRVVKEKPEELITSFEEKSMDQQKGIIIKTLTDFMEKEVQRDDITIIGLKVK